MRLKNVFLCVFLPLRPFIRPTVHLLQGYLLSFMSPRSFPPSKLFFNKSFLATGSFICQNWINIVDGTNIVNLAEEWSWLNSISADNTGGKALRDSATLLKVFCSGEVIGLDKGVMQSLPSLMPKCPSNLRVEFFCSYSFSVLTIIWLILWILSENDFSIDSEVISGQYETDSWLFLLYDS